MSTESAPAPAVQGPLLDAAQRARVQRLLGPQARVEVVEQAGSTNRDLARTAELEARHGRPLGDLSLLAADFQSAGSGRLDRAWVTPAGQALTFSLALRPHGAGAPLPTQHYAWLTLLLAAAIASALREHGLDAAIKWPNDVLVGGRKISGILAQLVGHDALPPSVVLGAGINVHQRELPVPQATSADLEGAELTRGRLLIEVLERFTADYRAFCADPQELTAEQGGLRARIVRLMGTLGQQVRAELPGAREPLTGRAVGLDAGGALLILGSGDARPRAVSAADIVHVRPAVVTDGGAEAAGGPGAGAQRTEGPGRA